MDDPSTNSIKVIGILNHNIDLIETLMTILMEDGYLVFTGYLPILAEREQMVIDFISQHHPVSIIYDIPPPYEANWLFVQQMIQKFPHVHFVLITTNKPLLEKKIGKKSDTIELVGMPFDLEEIVSAVTHSKAK